MHKINIISNSVELKLKTKEKNNYDPAFVAKIQRAINEEGRIIDPKNIWESLEQSPYNTELVAKIKKVMENNDFKQIDTNKIWENI